MGKKTNADAGMYAKKRKARKGKQAKNKKK